MTINSLVESVETKDAPIPIGPYSQACITPDVLSTSGQIGLNPDTKELEDDAVKQTLQAIRNVEAIKKEGRERVRNLRVKKDMERHMISYENRVFIAADSVDKERIRRVCINRLFPGTLEYIDAEELPLKALVEIRLKETYGYPKPEFYTRTSVHSCNGNGSDAIAEIEKELEGRGFSLKGVFYAQVCTKSFERNYIAFNEEFARSFPHKPSRAMFQQKIQQDIEMFCEAYRGIS
jgi:hypothetical protein